MTSSYRIVLYQACIAVAVAAVVAPIGLDQSIAALQAGLVCAAPNVYFAWRAGVERSPARLLAQGVGKQWTTIALMAAVFAMARPAPLGFFAAFIAVQLMYVVGAARGSGTSDTE
jgi:F0F1-type ATP synthase assembly protein I